MCSSLKELFENVDAATIMEFIKEIIFLSFYKLFSSFPFNISYRSLVLLNFLKSFLYIILFLLQYIMLVLFFPDHPT